MPFGAASSLVVTLVSRLMIRTSGRRRSNSSGSTPQTYASSTGRGIGPLARSARRT
jgi:hypothetical protein